ncbi:MAG: hypothetical protein WAQ28_05260 [Bacteroidia bacterium]
MDNRIIVIIISLFLCGCSANPLGPVDEATCKPLETKPTDSLVIGTYTLDSFSVDFIKSFKTYPDEKSVLTITSDKKLLLENFPDSIYAMDNLIKRRLINTTGNWSINKNQDKWCIDLRLDSIGTKGMSTSADLYTIKDKLSIWLWIGDPDAGKRLLYVKQK